MSLCRFFSAFVAFGSVLLLTQCHSFRSDCEEIALREQAIAQEPAGDYFIGRRYYVPTTRFWGYLRRPGQSWSTAQLVIMDEHKAACPDRGLEPPLAHATFGSDANVEYVITGKYLDAKAYEPNSNQVLPVFQASSYQLRDAKPGFLFSPSEEYSSTYVSLFPYLMPNPADCRKVLSERR
ncbi:MAG: hypothetical protein R3Y56_04450 [Akkermansia sp.]